MTNKAARIALQMPKRTLKQETTLVARRTAHQLQDSRAHFQGPKHVNADISELPHADMSTRSRHSVISDSSAVRAVHHINYAKHAFRCSAADVWNSLPRTVIDCVTLSTFKSKLKTFLFSNTFTNNQLTVTCHQPPALLKLRPKALYKCDYYYNQC